MTLERTAPSRRRFLWPVLAVVVLAAAAGTWASLKSGDDKKAGDDKKKDAPRTFDLAAGDVAPLRKEPLGRQIPVSGSLKPVLSATLRSKVPAEVARVHVQDGQRVAAGEVLFTLDTADLQARHDREMAAVAEAKARLDLAKKNEANNKALLEKNFISRNAYDSVLNTVQVAEANLRSAEAQAAISRRALDDARIRAPWAGVVARRLVNMGDKVSTDAPVAQLVDLARMEVEAQVPVSEVPYIKVGQPIDLRVDGFAKPFAARVERINPSAEAGSRALSIFVTLANPDGQLRGGMFASGRLDTAEGAPVDVLPAKAVLEEGGQTFVLVVKNGQVERRTIVLGVRNDERGLVEVREGLEAGVPVVLVKADGLKAGAKATLPGDAKAAPAADAKKS
ncbi:MAG TPA: efflux RND transporter periplasmic adaptor subunit [Usitatibacteraceae bacterium]|nr:efflux RND transporter periplasmic adaptor subunit [Usitatibacteraceae bacterium]